MCEGSPGEAQPPRPTFAEAVRFWLKLGFISFGGPTGQIAIMHTELVERRRWISEPHFLHALNYCMLLPGPEAQQLATYMGWLLHRAPGGIAAGVLFVVPSAFILWGLSWIYAAHGDVPWIASIFDGLKPAVTAIVAAAVIRIGRRALKNPVMWMIALLAFVAIFVLRVPFPAIIFTAATVGFVGGRLAPRWFVVIEQHGDDADALVHESDDLPQGSWRRAIMVTVICTSLWMLPMVLLGLWLGWNDVFVREGVFFMKMAMVTFGGAYAVLPYVAQQAVEQYQWLSATQMLDGLGLAETTPGPLIMVVQFVGFMAGWNHAGDGSPLAAATIGAAVATWVTFVPCFLWIFLGAPHIERLRGSRLLSAALSTVTAAVVGVVLNLAVWFGLHVLLSRDGGVVSPDWFAAAVCVVTFIGMARWNWGIVPVVLASGAAGLMWHTLLPPLP